MLFRGLDMCLLCFAVEFCCFVLMLHFSYGLARQPCRNLSAPFQTCTKTTKHPKLTNQLSMLLIHLLQIAWFQYDMRLTVSHIVLITTRLPSDQNMKTHHNSVHQPVLVVVFFPLIFCTFFHLFLHRFFTRLFLFV